jgi:hypothetical protein
MVLTNSFITKRGQLNFRHKTYPRLSNAVGGSILLQKGGPGVGSSYGSVENRHETIGMGLKSLVNLRSLEMRPTGLVSSKPKNISF